ncbi:MAG TPA: class I SAM-dependent methyltransferase [Vicinamibacterales bacterium]
MRLESHPAALQAWLDALEERHLADLTISEVTRGLRALSSCYVERREKLSAGGALDGAGKRAAFALFYGPQHFLITQEIVSRVRATPARPVDRVLDLGCGTGSAGSAAALASGAARIEGFDLNPWAVREANWTYRIFDLDGRATVTNLSRLRMRAASGTLILAAYAVNELPDALRSGLLRRFQDAHRAGASVLVIEPIARRVNVWWKDWATTFTTAGGREDDWRFDTPLPPRQRLLAKAAGLAAGELMARSLYLPGPPADSE